MVFKVAVQVCIPTMRGEVFPYSTSSPIEAVISVFDLGHSDRCKMVSQSHFVLHFSDI